MGTERPRNMPSDRWLILGLSMATENWVTHISPTLTAAPPLAPLPIGGPIGMRLFIADDHPLILGAVGMAVHAIDPTAEVTGFATVVGL